MTSEFLCETLNVMNKKIVITNVQLNVSYFFGSKLTEKEPFLELKPFWLILWSITPPRTSRFPVSCSLIGCRLLPMYIQSEFISHSRFWIADRFRYLACQIFHGRQRFFQIASDYSHCMIVTCLNEHRFASDFGHLSGILQNLSASKNRC